MPRSLWKGAISFGLITIPVKLYGATEEKDISFNQVHLEDGGRIRYKRVCEKCGEEVEFAKIGKGYTAADGRQAVLEKADFDELPLSSSKAVDIVKFVELDSIDPTYLQKSYFLEAEGAGVKPYVLLRDALAKTGKCAVVKIALRSRESLALVRTDGDLLMLQAMLWPDELRDGEFAAPSSDVTASEPEVAMAEMFIDQLSGEFDPDEFNDGYREALETLVNAKLEGAPMPTEDGESEQKVDVVDLVAALRASVDAAKKRRAEADAAPAEEAPTKNRKKAS